MLQIQLGETFDTVINLPGDKNMVLVGCLVSEVYCADINNSSKTYCKIELSGIVINTEDFNLVEGSRTNHLDKVTGRGGMIERVATGLFDEEKIYSLK